MNKQQIIFSLNWVHLITNNTLKNHPKNFIEESTINLFLLGTVMSVSNPVKTSTCYLLDLNHYKTNDSLHRGINHVLRFCKYFPNKDHIHQKIMYLRECVRCIHISQAAIRSLFHFNYTLIKPMLSYLYIDKTDENTKKKNLKMEKWTGSHQQIKTCFSTKKKCY